MIMDNYQTQDQKEAENQLLACIFADPDGEEGVMAGCVDKGVSSAMFTDVRSSIFETCLHLFREDIPIEPITCAIEAKLPPVDLMEIGQMRETCAPWKYFVTELLDYDLKNRLRRASMYISDNLADLEADELFCEASRMLEERPLQDSGSSSSRQITDGFVERMRANELEGVNIVTGLDEIDRMLRIRKGQLITIAARPSYGKSAFGGQIAFKNAVTYKKSCAFFSLEMSKDELMLRGLSLMSGVTSDRIVDGMVNEEQKERIDAALQRIADASLHIFDEPAQTTDMILSRAKQLKAKGGLDLIVVDYVQLIKPNRASDPRHEQVGQITRDLKGIAKKLNVPVIQLAQINREAAKTNRRPKEFDLRESGSLEQDSDTILFIHPKDAEDESTKVGVEIIVAKQRNGPKGIVDLHFVKPRSQFKPMQNEF
jgi:replicative DNA helicase